MAKAGQRLVDVVVQADHVALSEDAAVEAAGQANVRNSDHVSPDGAALELRAPLRSSDGVRVAIRVLQRFYVVGDQPPHRRVLEVDCIVELAERSLEQMVEPFPNETIQAKLVAR